MTLPDHTRYWRDTAAPDWEAALSLQDRTPRPALALAHWTLEKLSKALWVRENQRPIVPGEGTDDVAEVLAGTSLALTPTQTAFVAHLKALHDDELEPDPARPVGMRGHETVADLLTQAAQLRRQLLAALAAEAAQA